TGAHLWPWRLTPLTARAIASWLIGLGIVLVWAILERDCSNRRSSPTLSWVCCSSSPSPATRTRSIGPAGRVDLRRDGGGGPGERGDRYGCREAWERPPLRIGQPPLDSQPSHRSPSGRAQARVMSSSAKRGEG